MVDTSARLNRDALAHGHLFHIYAQKGGQDIYQGPGLIVSVPTGGWWGRTKASVSWERSSTAMLFVLKIPYFLHLMTSRCRHAIHAIHGMHHSFHTCCDPTPQHLYQSTAMCWLYCILKRISRKGNNSYD